MTETPAATVPVSVLRYAAGKCGQVTLDADHLSMVARVMYDGLAIFAYRDGRRTNVHLITWDNLAQAEDPNSMIDNAVVALIAAHRRSRS